MQRSDRWVGLGLGLLGLLVLWTARTFPNVPGQKLGAGFLPMLVGAGLVLCALVLVSRSLRAGGAAVEAKREHYGSALVIIAATLGYVLLAERIGFLIVAPVVLVAIFLALRVRVVPALAWALAGTIVVHFAFYKLLRVPLPWGALRPFY